MKQATRRGNVFVRLAVPVVIGAALATTLSAQPAAQNQPSIVRAPTSGNTTDKPPKYRMYFTVLVIGGLLIGANAIPSKRGHQD